MSITLTRQLAATSRAGRCIAADIDGVNLTSLNDSGFAAIETAWREHLVLRFRAQNLTPIDLVNFSRRFGKLEPVPQRTPPGAADLQATHDPRLAIAPPACDFVAVVSNARVCGRPLGGFGTYETHWHTDLPYSDRAPIASLLYGIEVPPFGGNTSFANMHAAYEALDPQTRMYIAGLTCLHDASRDSAGELRRGFAEVTDPRETTGKILPLVRTHPATRRKYLFLGRRRNAYIPGLSLEDSEALLDLLWHHATDARFCWTQTWRAGDLLLWDNRCVLHRRELFDDQYDRVLHRTQIAADRHY
jgi:taurine dioxygenase